VSLICSVVLVSSLWKEYGETEKIFWSGSDICLSGNRSEISLFLHTMFLPSVSYRRSEPLREPGASVEAGRNQSVCDGVRRSSRRHRLRSGRRSGKTRLSKPSAVHYDDDRRRLLHQHCTGQLSTSACWTFVIRRQQTVQNGPQFYLTLGFSVDLPVTYL